MLEPDIFREAHVTQSDSNNYSGQSTIHTSSGSYCVHVVVEKNSILREISPIASIWTPTDKKRSVLIAHRFSAHRLHDSHSFDRERVMLLGVQTSKPTTGSAPGRYSNSGPGETMAPAIECITLALLGRSWLASHTACIVYSEVLGSIHGILRADNSSHIGKMRHDFALELCW